ncbi:Shedu immune nuclease family protein [uncultured Sphingomonas sp.]|uniref:Shedu immune nuclease family protein n=1 Tax=uncultured Sphingomonas sp. TaxID=158754 RepID=UPI0030F9AD2A
MQLYAVAKRTDDDLGINLIRTGEIYGLQVDLSPKAIERAVAANPAFDVDKVSYELARYDPETVTLTTYPLNLVSDSRYFLTPKYRKVRSIAFEGHGNVFAGPGDVSLEFPDLPLGFVRDMFAGFGVNYEYRFIIEQLERTASASAVVMSEYFESKIDDDVVHLTYDTFDRWRRALRRSHNTAVSFANRSKSVYLRGQVEKELGLVSGAHVAASSLDELANEMTEVLALPGRRRPLSAATAAIASARSGSGKLAAGEAAELLDLNREIELLTLEQLIARLEGHLASNHNEAFWQRFFTDNPFILRLAFGLPIAIFGEQVAVGGTKFDGSGGKIADYVVKAGHFGNLAIVEIKTPQTPLLETGAYRGEVHAPTKHLSGAITQALDQRYQLQTSINDRKISSGVFDVFSFAMQGLVIAGRDPTGPAERKSFELFRNGLKDVTVVTFDELLAKLRALHEFLGTPE